MRPAISYLGLSLLLAASGLLNVQAQDRLKESTKDQSVEQGSKKQALLYQVVEITLKNGNAFKGTITKEDDKSVTLSVGPNMSLDFAKKDIETIRTQKTRSSSLPRTGEGDAGGQVKKDTEETALRHNPPRMEQRPSGIPASQTRTLEGWDKAKFGMSLRDIEALYPGGKANEREEYRCSSYEVQQPARHIVSARFDFFQDQLHSIDINFPIIGPPDEELRLADYVQMFASRYGMGFDTDRKLIWTFADEHSILMDLSSKFGPSVVNVSYFDSVRTQLRLSYNIERRKERLAGEMKGLKF